MTFGVLGTRLVLLLEAASGYQIKEYFELESGLFSLKRHRRAVHDMRLILIALRFSEKLLMSSKELPPLEVTFFFCFPNKRFIDKM